MARDRKGPSNRAQVLINPALHLTGLDGKDFPAEYRLFRDFYLKDSKDAINPLASTLKAENFAGLPPAFVIVSETDTLRDQGEEYVKRFRDARVRANGYCHFRQGHLVPRWAAAAPPAEEALNLSVGFLKAVFRLAK